MKSPHSARFAPALLQQQMDGSYGVSREDENSISKRELAKLTPDMLQRIRAQYRC